MINLYPLLLEPAVLATALTTGNLPAEVVIVDVGHSSTYAQLHVPGAVHVQYERLTHAIPPAAGKLPDIEQLDVLFGELGHHEQMHYIVYDDSGGAAAARFIWTLEMIGHTRYSYLNGGIRAWLDEQLPVEKTPNQRTAVDVELDYINDGPISSKEQLLAQLENPEVVLWDARSAEEFTGEKQLAARGGHIPGAINYDWMRAIDPNNGYRIRPDAFDEMKALGITPGKTVIAYCQSHRRSAFAFLLAKSFGYPSIKAYDGAWSEWGNDLQMPITKP